MSFRGVVGLLDVVELVGVDDRVHSLDVSLCDVEPHNADQSFVQVDCDCTGLAVDLDTAEGEAARTGRGAGPCEQGSGDAGPSVLRSNDGGDLSAAVTMEYHVVGQEGLESFEVSGFDRREEALRELLTLLTGRLEPWLAALQAV